MPKAPKPDITALKAEVAERDTQILALRAEINTLRLMFEDLNRQNGELRVREAALRHHLFVATKPAGAQPEPLRIRVSAESLELVQNERIMAFADARAEAARMMMERVCMCVPGRGDVIRRQFMGRFQEPSDK